jgi:hypothetical protein
MGKQLETLVPRNQQILLRRQAVLKEALKRPPDDADHGREHEERELYSVEAALQRMREGTYGQCVDCANGINIPRLQALPNAERCIDCQRDEEKKTGPVPFSPGSLHFADVNSDD